MPMRIDVYGDSDKRVWDDFVRRSKNGTFLFLRDYMDYHQDRFHDHSLLVRANENLIAVLPANKDGETLTTHEGLTYGGFVVSKDMKLSVMSDLFRLLFQHLLEHGVTRLVYKTIPRIYHSYPAEEDLYCLARNGGALYRTDVLTVIDYSNRLKYQERRARAVNRGKKRGLIVRQSEDWAEFWEILAANLRARYDLKPVHAVDEIRLLASRFRDEIRLYAAYEGASMQAGAVVYLTASVCHVQYNAATARGKDLAAHDVLMDYLIERHADSSNFFDFGASTEKEGTYLQTGLVDYKEGFGGRCVVHDFFKFDLAQT